ncbi:MAG: radical SAM protein, partial [Erythrobacter cryptus]
FPERAAKVMGILREMRAGRDNDPRFFSRMKAQGVWAELIRSRIRLACIKSGIPTGAERVRFELDCTRFRPPASSAQLALF